MEHSKHFDGVAAATDVGSRFWRPHPGPRQRGRSRGAAPNPEADAQAHPYHHGNLRRALLEAARRLLEAEGPSALSLRALAREVGVSYGAPYHHFRDKAELLDAVAERGWQALRDALATARASPSTPRARLGGIGLAYVKFARANPALYRLMYDTKHAHAAVPEPPDGDDGFGQDLHAFREAPGDHFKPHDIELAAIASWCVAHGLAEMAGFIDFAPLKLAMGGEDAFVSAVLDQLGQWPAPDGPRSGSR